MQSTATSRPASVDASTFRSRADEVYAQLKRDVADFKLVPGDRLTEGEISERLGVSRAPVRQALFRLQQEGFVEVLFRAGWRVLPFDFDQFEQLYETSQTEVRKITLHQVHLARHGRYGR